MLYPRTPLPPRRTKITKPSSLNLPLSTIKTPTTLTSTGATTQVSHAEATLNWQSENAVAQNKALNQILSQQSIFSKAQEAIYSKVKTIDELIT